jgi:hypothetical protein
MEEPMKTWVLAVMVASAVGTTGMLAQQQAQPQRPGQPGAQQPRDQPTEAKGPEALQIPKGEQTLGTVRIPRNVMADGKPLAAGTYQVFLTAETAGPEAVGQIPELNRWVEFRRAGQVQGREVVSIVPSAEIGEVANVTPPRPGQSRVELLRGGDYLRVWLNRDGVHYLIHLPPA